MNQGSEPDRQLARLVKQLGDRYEFLSLLGRGGSGTVYEVENRSLKRREALKVLSESFLEEKTFERFAHEAKVSASLDHPNIVKIYGIGQDEGSHWYSMQLVDGPSLSGLLDAGLRFDETMLLQLAIPMLRAVAFSHAHGVIHRDIKPANILFSADGQPFLADFGIAKSEESAVKTRTGHMMGTPAYVAPEQALGELVDARADQYSLGITLYKTITGSLPFSGSNALQALVHRLQQDPDDIEVHRPDLHPELIAILMRSLARDKTHRWDSINDMLDALLNYADRQPINWDQPLRQVTDYPLSRTPLASAPVPEHSPQGSFDPTSELPLRARPRWGWRIAGAVLFLLAVAAGSARFLTTKAPLPPMAATIQKPVPITPAPALPLPTNRPPKETQEKTNPEPSVPLRRPVTYPQLLEGSTLVTPIAGCSGLRINVALKVGVDGSVLECKVLSAIRPECAEAAKAIALRYRFKPALDAQGLPLETTLAAAVDLPEVP